jgi:hypothetical protein
VRIEVGRDDASQRTQMSNGQVSKSVDRDRRHGPCRVVRAPNRANDWHGLAARHALQRCMAIGMLAIRRLRCSLMCRVAESLTRSRRTNRTVKDAGQRIARAPRSDRAARVVDRALRRRHRRERS